MNSEQPAAKQRDDSPGAVSEHELLLRMDLATEVLEGLDELGLDNRTEVEALLLHLERQIADSR